MLLNGPDPKTLDNRQVVNYGIVDWVQGDIVLANTVVVSNEVDAQLNAHIRIASNVGLTKKQLTALAAVLDETVGKKQEMRVSRAIQAVLPDQGERS